MVSSKLLDSFQICSIFSKYSRFEELTATDSPQSLAVARLTRFVCAVLEQLSAVGAYGRGSGAAATSFLGFFHFKEHYAHEMS